MKDSVARQQAYGSDELRQKVTVMLPGEICSALDAFSERLGVPKNALISLAVARFLADWGDFAPDDVLTDVRARVIDIIDAWES